MSAPGMETTVDRLKAALLDANVAAALLSSPEDVCYATGFEVPPPIDVGAAFAFAPALAVVSADGNTTLLAPNAYAARAEETSRADNKILVPTPFGQLEEVDAREAVFSAVRAALRDAGVGRSSQSLAIDERTLPLSVGELLRSEFAGTKLADARRPLDRARSVKTPRELELLRRAVALADAGQEALTDVARSGRNELDVMAAVVARIQAAAGRPVAWTGELVAGQRIGVLRYPGGPVDRTLEQGDMLLMDLSVRLGGYWADCCNTIVVDRTPNAEQMRYFGAARAAFEAAVEQLRPGRRASDVHEAADRELVRSGFRSAHYTGHQLGTSVNEAPRLVPYDHTRLEAGMVFAVEPGVYAGDMSGVGARTEKVVLVGDDGPEILSRFEWGVNP